MTMKERKERETNLHFDLLFFLEALGMTQQYVRRVGIDFIFESQCIRYLFSLAMNYYT